MTVPTRWTRLRARFRRRADLDKEIAAHLEEATEEFLRQGLPPDEAKRAARRNFGGVTQTKEAYRDGLPGRWVGHLGRDLRTSWRSLRRQPSFFVTSISALALGIAAPTALFAVVHATMLRPLPYADPASIFTVRTTMTDGRFTIGLVASEELASLRRATSLVAASALVGRVDDMLAAAGDQSRPVAAVGVTEGFFDVFGVPMAMGRAFQPGDHRSKTVRSVVLSEALWRTFFSADPSIAGRTIHLASGPALVVGVAPASFDAPSDADLWVAISISENIGHLYDAYVRFTPGTQPAHVQAQLGPMWEALAQKYPDQAKNRIFVFRPLLSSILGDLAPTAVMAFAATALLLLLAMANVTNLLLARGAARTRELAVRIAIGATRRHLIRQLLSEAMVIAAVAAAIGVPLAYVSIQAIVAIGGEALPRAEGLRFDPGVAAFAMAIVTLSGIGVGIVPAFAAAETRAIGAVADSGRGGTANRRTRRLLATLVMAEVALAIVLVAGAGRLLLSARNLLAVDPGFAASNRLIVDVLLPRRPYGPLPGSSFGASQPSQVWAAEALTRLRGVGAATAGLAGTLPLRPERETTTFTDIVGRPVEPRFRPNGRARVVSPGFFATMGIALERGRDFTADDRREGPPVVIVNRAWAAKFLPPDADPLLERLSGLFYRQVNGAMVALTAPIVGVVADVRYASLDARAEPTVYFAHTQQYAVALRHSFVVTTTDGRPERLIPGIRRAFAELDPKVPVEFESMDDVVSRSLVWSRLGVLLMTTFGAASLLLAATGVFGVLAFVSAQRHDEMAVRMSLGATRGGVFRLILGQGARFAIAGGALGTALAWWMGRAMDAYVYEVSAASPLVLAGSATVVSIVALAAALAPARRAAAVHPARALRS